MTKKELFQEIGDINEKYLLEAEETRRSIIHNVVFQRSLATAACLVVCVGLGITILTFSGGSKEAASEAGSSMGPNSVASNSAMKEEASADGAMDWYEEENILQNVPDDEVYQENEPGYVIREPEEEKQEDISDSVGVNVGEMVYDATAVKVRLAGYPDDFAALCNSNAFVVVHGTVECGLEQWERFQQTLESGEATVDIVQFTEEGDAIITNVTYTGNSYHIVEDNTRDAWGNSEYVEVKYTYCYVIEENGYVEILLSNETIDVSAPRDDYEEAEVYSLVQYRIFE